MEKQITLLNGAQKIILSIGPSSIEECLGWSNNEEDFCIKQYLNVLENIKMQCPSYEKFLVSFFDFGISENKMQKRIQERFKVDEYFSNMGFSFSKVIDCKFFDSFFNTYHIVSVASVGCENLKAFFCDGEELMKNYLVVTRNYSMEELLNKARQTKCENFLKSLSLNDDLIITYFDIGADGNNITIYYNNFCPNICGVESKEWKDLQTILNNSKFESVDLKYDYLSEQHR